MPKELIAQTPLEPRDSSALLDYNLSTGEILDKKFYEIIDALNEEDVLVLNNTKVIPARLYCYTENNTKIEVLLLKQIDKFSWEVLMKPARKAHIGQPLKFSDSLYGKVTDVEKEHGLRIIKFEYEGSFEEIIDKIGYAPIPPYIETPLEDKTKYQTVYAKYEGSAAAPTAGLHFTDELLNKIKAKNIKIVEILLHVGLGTFRPVKTTKIEDHVMHKEYVKITKEAAQIINDAKRKKQRIIAVGTTSVRALESFADENGFLTFGEKNTDIFIYPPYKFKIVDALITNFHLPESSLLMLVSSLTGIEEMKKFMSMQYQKNIDFIALVMQCLFINNNNAINL